ISLAKGRQVNNCLCLGVDRLASSSRVLAPIRNQAPTKRVERYFSSVMITPDDEQFLTGRSVPVGRIIADAAIPYIQAINDGISKRPAALNYTSAHGSNIGLPRTRKSCLDTNWKLRPGVNYRSLHGGRSPPASLMPAREPSPQQRKDNGAGDE